MIRTLLAAVTLTGCVATASQPTAAALGEPAPDFTLKDLAGAEHTLSAHRGKTVVLEWFNPGCPYVQHQHTEGPLKDMAARVAGEGVVWLAINSGAPGKQGHGVETNQQAVAQWNMGHPVLVDEDGAVGRAYGAVTTPHMYVIDPAGALVYRGAIDNLPLGKGEGQLQNFVDKALADLEAGGPVKLADTKPYGCSVKY
jgi:peroxiredoxin